jgi:hypothetical protein
MRLTITAALGGAALLAVLVCASLLPSTAALASPRQSGGSSGQIVPDPTMQALAAEAALALTEVAQMPTPNPTDIARIFTQAGAITIQGTLAISGAVQISDSYSEPMFNIPGLRDDLGSCTAFAQGQHPAGGGSGFRLPDPPLGGKLGGHEVLIPVEVSPYPGPGDYGRNQGIQAGPGVIIDDADYGRVIEGTDYHVTVKPDGSGSFTFTNLYLYDFSAGPDAGPNQAISGSLIWTCSQ